MARKRTTPHEAERTRSIPCQAVVAEGLMSISAVREFLGGVSRAFLYNEFNRGNLPWVAIGRRRMVPRQALVDYAAKRIGGAVID